MRRALRSLLLLGALAALSGWAIAWFAGATAERAERNRAAAEARILRELAGVAATESLPSSSGDVLYCDDSVAILRDAARGYGGQLRLAVAFAADGSVSGVRVLEHAETPGFADILAPDSPWLASFGDGRVDAVTGATVTSEAVLRAVQGAITRYDGALPCPTVGETQ